MFDMVRHMSLRMRAQVRKAFCSDASIGNALIVADYGQLELRILAHMAQCESMIRAFVLGGDFHSRTAYGMYDHIQDAVKVILMVDAGRGWPPVMLGFSM